MKDMHDLKYLQLFDAYGQLLTEHRRDVCELYYQFDLSLGEIAEQKGVSRQSVSDTLAKSRALLDEYEAKLHHGALLGEAEAKLCALRAHVRQALEAMQARHPELAEEIGRILALLQAESGQGGASADRSNNV